MISLHLLVTRPFTHQHCTSHRSRATQADASLSDKNLFFVRQALCRGICGGLIKVAQDQGDLPSAPAENVKGAGPEIPVRDSLGMHSFQGLAGQGCKGGQLRPAAEAYLCPGHDDKALPGAAHRPAVQHFDAPWRAVQALEG